MVRKLHEIWKMPDGWKVQCPKGVLTFKTKRAAAEWVRAAADWGRRSVDG